MTVAIGPHAGSRRTRSMALSLVVVAVIPAALTGCPITSSNLIRIEATEGDRVTELSFQCPDANLSATIQSVEDFHVGEIWSEYLDISFRNQGPDTLLYDWSDLTLTFGDTPPLHPLEVSVKGKWSAERLVVLPSKRKTQVRFSIWGTDEYLETYRSREVLLYRMGVIRALDSTVVCTLPTITAKSQGKYP